MAFDCDNNYNVCSNNKRCFLTLVLFNFFLACTYYFYEHNQSDVRQNAVKHFPNIFYQHELSRKTDNSIEIIRNILENEYNRSDLQIFYDLVEKEFALGLRCTRNQNKKSNVDLTISETNNTNITIIRSLSSTTTSHLLPPNHHSHRTLYSFLISNSDICLTESVDLLIMIISKSENYKTRDAIRRTWGSRKNLGIYSSISIKIFFLIDFDEKFNNNVRLENNLFHDIIQVELPQQYTLVTYRVLSILEWSFRYCRRAKFVFKTDDDIFINLIILLKFVSPLITNSSNNSFHISDMTIYGYKHINPGVFRQASDPVTARYVVTSDEYPCSRYPDFLSGFGYLIPKKARDALVYASYYDYEKPFRISDVYVTGILPDYLSLPRTSMSDYQIRYVNDCEGFFANPNAFACAAGLHHGDTSDVFDKFHRYWQLIRKLL
ncbi:unnamed protein product [Adineta steineri]|uniref:Hexosyltransferase n=2 Tax=Adineta steineri TaxID=433720 RepID=A0A819MVB1_9BILA|nr:unnamed protein product [Adineta steineri]CAF3986787.1 unnamed protein product [Adineta steineri]